MKKLAFCLSILSIVFITSCGSDDAPEPGLSGTVTFNEQSYSIQNGVVALSVDDGNAAGSFFMSDGTVTSNGDGGATISGADIAISMAMGQAESSTLGEGSYPTNSSTTGQVATVRVTLFDGADQTASDSVVGGSVTLAGSGNTYTITFVDVPFGQGVTLTGTVTGTYSN